MTRKAYQGPAKLDPVGAYICGLCKKAFSRKQTVMDPHFAACARKNGNPDNLPWDSDPSCWSRRGDGSFAPSGKVPPGVPAGSKSEFSSSPAKHKIPSPKVRLCIEFVRICPSENLADSFEHITPVQPISRTAAGKIVASQFAKLQQSFRSPVAQPFNIKHDHESTGEYHYNNCSRSCRSE